jgi:hypothetical protein
MAERAKDCPWCAGCSRPVSGALKRRFDAVFVLSGDGMCRLLLVNFCFDLPVLSMLSSHFREKVVMQLRLVALPRMPGVSLLSFVVCCPWIRVAGASDALRA